MDCRPGCGACCIAPSISTPMPGHPQGKPAGVRCANLAADLSCVLWGLSERPACCGGLQPSSAMCGTAPADALFWLARLGRETLP